MRVLPAVCSAALLAAVSAASSNDASPPFAPVQAPSRVATQATADLALTKVADKRNVRVGDNVTFTITVKNNGPSAATNVTFGDPVPDPLNLVSFTCNNGSQSGATFCTADVPVGGSVSATLVATPISNPARSERKFSNTAYIAHSDADDPNSSNNTASVEMRIVGKTP